MPIRQWLKIQSGQNCLFISYKFNLNFSINLQILIFSFWKFGRILEEKAKKNYLKELSRFVDYRIWERLISRDPNQKIISLYHSIPIDVNYPIEPWKNKIQQLATKLWPKNQEQVEEFEIFAFLAITLWPIVEFALSIAQKIALDVGNRMVYNFANNFQKFQAELCGATVLMCAVVVGFRSRPTTMALACWLAFINFTQYAWWQMPVTHPYREFLTFDFFQTLSVIGGLLLAFAHGPGRISMDAYNKKQWWRKWIFLW